MADGSGDAIVVAEAKPTDSDSSYKRTVVGLIATKEKEPAVYRGFQVGVGTKFMKATTQENVHVVQTVEPIYFDDRIIGVFIVEQKMEQVGYTHKKNDISSDIDDVALIHESKSVVDNIEEGLIFVG